jgi:hypothetical protein
VISLSAEEERISNGRNDIKITAVRLVVIASAYRPERSIPAWRKSASNAEGGLTKRRESPESHGSRNMTSPEPRTKPETEAATTA